MAGLTVGDSPEWEDIKKDFINNGASLKIKILSIQRLTKEYAVGMDNAEAVVDRWGREYREEARKTREKFTFGDAVRNRSRHRK
jgi:hypothetical protein